MICKQFDIQTDQKQTRLHIVAHKCEKCLAFISSPAQAELQNVTNLTDTSVYKIGRLQFYLINQSWGGFAKLM